MDCYCGNITPDGHKYFGCAGTLVIRARVEFGRKPGIVRFFSRKPFGWRGWW